VRAKPRHDLRSRLSAIQNAAFWLERKTRGTPLWGAEPRVASFFELIADEVRRAQAILSTEATVDGPWRRGVTAARIAPCLERALGAVRWPEGVIVEARFADTADVEMDPTEIALLAKCLIDDAVEAMPEGGVLAVRSFDAGERVVLEIQGSGAGSRDVEPDQARSPTANAGLGLGIARRAAARAGAELAVRSPDAGTLVAVSFPVAREAEGAAHARST
jgi:signal transduction histidine kinase